MIPGRKVQRDDTETEISVGAGRVTLSGTLGLPRDTRMIVVFAHGSGSSRHSPRNRYVARTLQRQGIGTLLFDLLTTDEEAIDEATAELRFNIPFLANRLCAVTLWLIHQPDVRHLKLGYFGASTGAAAALVAAAQLSDAIGAVVSRGGRPDLAGDALTLVKCPTLLIVGGNDRPVIQMNQDALSWLKCEKRLILVPGATHLFEEPDALEQVARLATQWFKTHLMGAKGDAAKARFF